MAKPLFWYQGLYLQPQHLQLADIYHQSVLTPYNKYIMPHLWGIAKLNIRESSLSNFDFIVEVGKFLFSDMSFVDLSDNGIIEKRSFNETWIEEGKDLIVYAGLKKNDFLKENVTMISNIDNPGKVETRFISTEEFEEITDLHLKDGPPAQVKKLSFFIKIFFQPEIENLDNHSLIPIARLVRSNKEIKIAHDFIPPSITLKTSKNLYNLIMEIHDQIKAKGRKLETYKRDKRVHTSDFDARDMIYFLAMGTFNRYIPLLKHMIDANVHPWQIYSVLGQIVGELSSFSERVSSTGKTKDGLKSLIEYDHKNLGESFSSAANLISELLYEITAGPEYIIPIKHDGSQYYAALKHEHFKEGNKFYLAIDIEEEKAEEIKKHFDRIIKISSPSNIESLIIHGMPGVPIKHLAELPPELSLIKNRIYFNIKRNNEQWYAIKKENSISVHWESGNENIKMELIITGKRP